MHGIGKHRQDGAATSTLPVLGGIRPRYINYFCWYTASNLPTILGGKPMFKRTKPPPILVWVVDRRLVHMTMDKARVELEKQFRAYSLYGKRSIHVRIDWSSILVIVIISNYNEILRDPPGERRVNSSNQVYHTTYRCLPTRCGMSGPMVVSNVYRVCSMFQKFETNSYKIGFRFHNGKRSGMLKLLLVPPRSK